MIYQKKYNAIIIGAGHAGIEASLVLSRMGFKTLVITINVDNIGKMSCNPAIGGLAKGHIVREIDALGGEMAKASDITGIQFKMLNVSKGPAVWAPRAQIDKAMYSLYMKNALENQNNLSLVQDSVKEIFVEGSQIKGVITERDVLYLADVIIVTTGTFLKGLIHVGDYSAKSGRMGDPSSEYLSDSLSKMGFEVGRLKTGTPARLNINSIDFSKIKAQDRGEVDFAFSHFTESKPQSKIDCWITHTNEETHKIIRDNINRSPLFSGKIKGTGPRYCPSIEDKVIRFKERNAHQLFLEPEGLNTNEVYINGLSSSLPEDVQINFIHTITGLENAHIIRIGYAVEYDFCNPTQLKSTLETKLYENLYFAGQINGTSGYEEAAGQGLIAGINAGLKLSGKEPFILDRTESYIGILIDDLVTKGVEEPYRMFTSRAEHRLNLRYDNTDQRLMNYGYQLGLIPEEMIQKLDKKIYQINEGFQTLKKKHLSKEEISKLKVESDLDSYLGSFLHSLLIRKILTIQDMKKILDDFDEYDDEVLRQIELSVLYEGYIKKQDQQISRYKYYENKKIPENFDYDKLTGLLTEAKIKLKEIRPTSIGQASRISGVNPSDINLLLIYLTRRESSKENN